MSVGINISGIPPRQIVGDEALLKFATSVKVEGESIRFIHLGVKDGAVRGKMNFRVNCFQTVDVAVDTGRGTRTAKFTRDTNGEDATLYPTSFDYNSDGFGGRAAYIPDTKFNRKVLVDGYHNGVSYEIVSDSVEKAVKKDADALKKRFENAKEKAWEAARKTVHANMKTFILGLKDKIGDGYEQTSEYKTEVAAKVDSLGNKNFMADSSWKETATTATK